MANPNRGEVSLPVGGTDYKLSFSVNALCELEELFDQPVAELAALMNDSAKVRMSVARAMVWAALRDHHEAVTLKEAGAIATEAGLTATMAAVGKAFSLAFPEAKKGSRPPNAAKGG